MIEAAIASENPKRQSRRVAIRLKDQGVSELAMYDLFDVIHQLQRATSFFEVDY